MVRPPTLKTVNPSYRSALSCTLFLYSVPAVPRPRIRNFLEVIQNRPAFGKAVVDLGNPHGGVVTLHLEQSQSAQEVGSRRGVESAVQLARDSCESMEVWDELQRGMLSKDESREERTWKSLW